MNPCLRDFSSRGFLVSDKGAAKRRERRESEERAKRKQRRREMKHLRRCLLTVAVMCCTTLSAQYSDILHLYADSAALADKLTVTLDADILSKYVWRGLPTLPAGTIGRHPMKRILNTMATAPLVATSKPLCPLPTKTSSGSPHLASCPFLRPAQEKFFG